MLQIESTSPELLFQTELVKLQQMESIRLTLKHII